MEPPSVAKKYYQGNDLYQFDEFQVNVLPGSRRPRCDNMYDVFVNIRDDEGEHMSTMRACQNYTILGDLVTSPHLRFENITNVDLLVPSYSSEKVTL